MPPRTAESSADDAYEFPDREVVGFFIACRFANPGSILSFLETQ